MPTESAPLVGAVGLLERAAGYARTSLALVTDAHLTRPTPCRGWNLHALLGHLDESLTALTQAADEGTVHLEPIQPGSHDIEVIRARVCDLLAAWAHTHAPAPVRVGDQPLDTSLLGAAGALEIAVHAWDLTHACEQPRPIPPELADELLDLAPLLISADDRPARFAPPIAIPQPASPSDRLLAFLGRKP